MVLCKAHFLTFYYFNIAIPYVDFIEFFSFSVSHPDFTSVGKSVVSRPSYVPSPYGAWLAISDNPTGDSFSRWFRHDTSINYAIESQLVLEWLNSSGLADTSNRCVGFQTPAEGEMTCNMLPMVRHLTQT